MRVMPFAPLTFDDVKPSQRGAYQRWINIHSRPFDERFWEQVDKRGPNECWVWKAHRNHNGYGVVCCGERRSVASRVAWVLSRGHIPEGLYVLHKCDNPACCNPDHLFTGTQADNVHDMIKKGRQPKGAAWQRSGLSDDKVLEIRRRYAPYQTSYAALAKEFGVSTRLIGMIVKGTVWKHLPAKAVNAKHVRRRGSAHPKAKLTELIVKEIKRRQADGQGAAAITRSLGLTESIVHDVMRGKTWKHVL